MEKIVVGSIIAIVALVILIAIYQAIHCVKWVKSEPRYHAPTYVKSGDVMIPVGGGYYADSECVEYK